MRLFHHTFNRLFQHDKWAIAVVKADPEQLNQGILPSPIQWLTPRFGQYMADPFLFRHNDKDYLLYELFTFASGTGKNVIAELVKRENGQYHLRSEQIICDEPFHQSYPFVFSSKENIYCIPEQSESNSLRLYRATDFPKTWMLDTVLIDNFPVVDPTIFQHKGRWWLLATSGRDGQQDSHLYAWHSKDLRGSWHPHMLNPIQIGHGKVRPAGPAYSLGNELYRPVQFLAKRYGDGGLLIKKVLELSPSTFCEQTVARIKPFQEYPRGLHHLCMGTNLAVVDGNRYASPVEVLIKCLGILRKKFTPSNRQ